MSKPCELCGRELTDSYKGGVCPVCKDEFVARKAEPLGEQRNQMDSSGTSTTLDANSSSLQQPQSSARGNFSASYKSSMGAETAHTGATTYQGRIELDKIAGLESTTAIVWLILGILQVLSLAFLLVGVWNIYWSTKSFKRATDIKNGQAWIPNTVDKELGIIILFIAINFIFGAVIGVIAPFLDLYIRDTILKKRYLFENNYN